MGYSRLLAAVQTYQFWLTSSFFWPKLGIIVAPAQEKKVGTFLHCRYFSNMWGDFLDKTSPEPVNFSRLTTRSFCHNIQLKRNVSTFHCRHLFLLWGGWSARFCLSSLHSALIVEVKQKGKSVCSFFVCRHEDQIFVSKCQQKQSWDSLQHSHELQPRESAQRSVPMKENVH